MAEPKLELRKSARIRDRAAALAERQMEEIEKQIGENQEQLLKQNQQEQQHRQQWTQYRNAQVVLVQKANRAGAVQAVRAKSSGKTLPGLRPPATTVTAKCGHGDTTVGGNASRPTLLGSVDSDSATDPGSDSGSESEGQDVDHDDDKEEEDDEEVEVMPAKPTKRLKRASSLVSSSPSPLSSDADSTIERRVQRGRRRGKMTPRATVSTTKTALRDRHSNAARILRPTRPTRTRRRRRNDDDDYSNDGSGTFNPDNYSPSLSCESSASERSVTLVSDDEGQVVIQWTPETYVRHIMAMALYTFMLGKNHQLTPLAMVIYWMPRVPNPYPEDTKDLWTMPFKALSPNWETAEVLDTLRTDQVAHWLHLPIGALLGFLTMAAPAELQKLNAYLHVRFDIMRAMQAMPSCFEWLKGDQDPQPEGPAYKILYRLRSLDDELQRHLIWSIQTMFRIRRDENTRNDIDNFTPRPYVERHYRAEFDFLLKAWNMFRVRTSPVIQYRASKSEFPGFEDKRATNRWFVKVDANNPRMEEIAVEDIGAIIEADHAFLRVEDKRRQGYMQNKMIDDELIIAAQESRCNLALLTPIKVSQFVPQLQSQAQAGDLSQAKAASTPALSAIDKSYLAPWPNATASPPVSAVPQDVLTKLGFGIQSSEEWVRFALKAMPKDDSWAYYELADIVNQYYATFPQNRLDVELLQLNDLNALFEKKIKIHKGEWIGRFAGEEDEMVGRRKQVAEQQKVLEEFQKLEELQRREQDMQMQQHEQALAMEIHRLQLQRELEKLHHQ
ncbi:hypothetical protein EC991_001666 [Linnemannia zychae]|nr:hypothetical protein EC991_001666 [Linnemannia zychae]